MSNGQLPPQPQPTNYVLPQTQAVPQTTLATSEQPKTESNVRPIPGVKFFSIATMTIAFLLCILGIVAIIIEAEDSYVGNPIWSGVLFVLPTGILGLTSYMKRTSLCTNVSYLVFSIITCVVCFQLLVYACIDATREWTYCDPFPGYDYHWYHYDDICQFDRGGRIAVDALIAVVAFAQLVLCIISLSFTCYGTFTCCYNCCRPAPPPAVIQYTAQNGTCQLVSVGGYQAPAAYQPVSLMVPVGQGGQTISPGFSVVAQSSGQGQPQPVLVPASPAQITMVQQPMNATPGAFVNPPAPTANGTSVTENKPEPQSETSKEQPQPDVSLSYGHTASDQFHDERNLLETV